MQVLSVATLVVCSLFAYAAAAPPHGHHGHHGSHAAPMTNEGYQIMTAALANLANELAKQKNSTTTVGDNSKIVSGMASAISNAYDHDHKHGHGHDHKHGKPGFVWGWDTKVWGNADNGHHGHNNHHGNHAAGWNNGWGNGWGNNGWGNHGGHWRGADDLENELDDIDYQAIDDTAGEPFYVEESAVDIAKVDTEDI